MKTKTVVFKETASRLCLDCAYCVEAEEISWHGHMCSYRQSPVDGGPRHPCDTARRQKDLCGENGAWWKPALEEDAAPESNPTWRTRR
jgi:hypothetical protein